MNQTSELLMTNTVGRKKFSCKYPGCTNWYYTQVPENFVNKHFFNFPRNPYYHQQWRNICKADSRDSTHWRICEDHFADSAFVNVRKDRLNWGALPLPLNEPTENKDLLLEHIPFPDDSKDFILEHLPIPEYSQEEIFIKLEPDDFDSSQCPSICYCCVDNDPCLFCLSHVQNSEVISDSFLQDHDYCRENRGNKIGVKRGVLDLLKIHVEKMGHADRHSLLLFDELYVYPGFQYESVKQYINGLEYVDKQTNRHALVFMVRGIRKAWKQAVAYYFTLHTLPSHHLKDIIIEIISQLQEIGLHVVGTVCTPSATYQCALSQLCPKSHQQPSSHYFFVNNRPIVTIFDVPRLFVDTRNALLKCKIEFAPQKYAKFEDIEAAFNLDQQRMFKMLPKLRKEHFRFPNSYMKMAVDVAAAQLSSSVASAIETCVVLANKLPSEAMCTAQFVQKIDDLFDSLNSSSPQCHDYKRFRCALSQSSPHLEFWQKLLTELPQWKVIYLKTNADVTNDYWFVRGWQTTIQSVIFLWNHLKQVHGYDYLDLRNLNLEPLENLFCNIRKHGGPNIYSSE